MASARGKDTMKLQTYRSDSNIHANRWNILLVPVSAVAWSGLFNPQYLEIPFMACHGVLGWMVSLQFKNVSSDLNNFLAAATVTFSAGVISRFSGRQALGESIFHTGIQYFVFVSHLCFSGNTLAGLYVLMPGGT